MKVVPEGEHDETILKMFGTMKLDLKALYRVPWQKGTCPGF